MLLCDFNIKGSHSLINGRGDSLLLGPEPRPFVPASLLQQLKSNVLFCQLVLFVVTEVWTETHQTIGFTCHQYEAWVRHNCTEYSGTSSEQGTLWGQRYCPL